jgi:predicted Zn-dependent protease
MSDPLRARLLPLALAIALSLPSVPVRAQSALPALGDAASADLDVNDERRLGEQIMREVRRDPAYLDDPVLLDYVNGLWAPLVASARRLGHIGADLDRPFAWELFLVRDPSVNAFALPGGHVGVHLGLIAMTTVPDELASVLAHELSHVTQRHIARSIGSAQRQGAVSLAAMVLGLLVASRASSPDAAQAAIAAGQAAMVQGQLNFSRDMEREADRIGYGLLEGAGFATQAMATMFEKLAAASRLNDNGAFPYLRSHPLTSERIAEASARMPERVSTPPTPLQHALMRARAQALMNPDATTQARMQDAPVPVQVGEERLVALYRRALVSAKLQDTVAARSAIELALASVPVASDSSTQRLLRWLGVEVFLGLGMPEQALALTRETELQRPAVLLRAQAVRAAPGTAAEARLQALRLSLETLQAWVSEHPQDAAAWHQLSLSAAAAGQPLRALRADAEARAASGDLAGAIDRLRSARRTDDHEEAIEKHVIDARLRTLEAQRRAELLADGRGR